MKTLCDCGLVVIKEEKIREFIKELKTRFCIVKRKGFCNTCYDCANINKSAMENL